MIDLTGFTRLVPPPSANRYWRVFRGRAVRSAEATAWLRYAADLLKADQEAVVTASVHIVLQEGKGVSRTADLDNFCKIAMDAIRPETYDPETGKVKHPGAGLIVDDSLNFVRSIRMDVIPEDKPSKSKRGDAALFVKVSEYGQE